RQDFNRMAASGGTPRDFGHRVVSHPALLVTSQVKMRSGTAIDISFSGDITETINFWRTRLKLASNWEAGRKLILQLEAEGKGPFGDDEQSRAGFSGWKFTGVDETAILEFLTAYEEHDASRKVKTRLLADYIREEALQGRLTNWTVALAVGSSPHTEIIGSSKFKLVRRSWFLAASTDQLSERVALQQQNHYRIRRLVSPQDESADLSSSEWSGAMALTLAEWEKDPRERLKPTRPSGTAIRRVRPATRGLLILYPLDGRDESPKPAESEKVQHEAQDIPVLGFAISFPTVAGGGSKVRYVVNNVYYQQEFGRPNTDVDDEDLP
ncbi:MAG: hypothetical protein LC667_02425, partial [Thioalkalivibrio sp.]|nr:hypothetical protein [Thioalkalivibrio sp.]